MFFLVPRATLVLLVIFLLLAILRGRRRRHYVRRKRIINRVAANLGRRSGQRRRSDPGVDRTRS